MATLPPSSAASAPDAPEPRANIHVVCAEPSIANHFLAELRDKDVQKDSLRFRRNLQRLGEIIALAQQRFPLGLHDPKPALQKHQGQKPNA